MRKKEKFINTLKNTDNRVYFISSLDVGDVWISKDEIREKKGYKFHNFIRRHMSMPHSKAKTTKTFMNEMIRNFSNSKQQFQSITEDISRKSNHKNIYTEFSLLFLNFIKLDLAKQNKIEDFVHRFGLLGDEDGTSENKENYFSAKNPHERIEPFLIWQYEQWHLSYAYNLWLQVIEIEERKKDELLLLETLLINDDNNYFTNLIPMIQNKYVKYPNTFYSAEPQEAPPYSNIVELKEVYHLPAKKPQ